MEYTHIKQPFEPVCDENSEILILGSLPSVKSRENGFYYGHPQNRFWKVLSAVLGKETPATIAEKKKMLLDSCVAVWDVIEECDIRGSSDSSIKNVVTADIPGLLQKTKVKTVFVNGKTAERFYQKYIQPVTGKACVVLPSTSPANAAYSLEKLTAVWREAIGAVWTQARFLSYDVKVSVEDFRLFLKQAHFRESDLDACLKVWTDFYGSDEREAEASVKVWYLREQNEITAVMTIGSAYDEMTALYETKGELLQAYAADCFAMGILRRAYELFGAQFYEREKKYPGRLRFFDGEQMKEVPKLLERMGVGEVSCNEALAMTPQKTVVFMTELSDEKNAACADICADCTRVDCPNRKKTAGPFRYGYQQIFGREGNAIWRKD